jgi:peptidyl-tRNA hydrolase, PTH1 family
MYLIIGLGNPGGAYAKNRHNIGFMLIDALAAFVGAGAEKKRFSSLVSEAELATPQGNVKALLMKPQTYMNLSGNAVLEAASFYKIKPDHIIVFHDELDLAPGRFRMKLGGGHAGHNGLRSIMSQIGPNFFRGRMGIGHPGDKALVHNYVLADFAKADQTWVNALIDACGKALPLLLSGDSERYQNEVMRLAPAPRHSPPGLGSDTVQTQAL